MFAQARKEEKMAYTAKDYGKLLGMEGFSETLLKNHFTLYQGYVTNTNKLMETFDQMLKEGKVGTPEYAELKRRFGWEFNGMRLHEYYFENLGGKDALDKGGKLSKKMAEDFGSYDAWEASVGPSCTRITSPGNCSTAGSMNMMWVTLLAAHPS
jgi:Fe-Mn family superoxide dismutase